MRILLVEDEKPLSAAIQKVLRQEKYLVDSVFNGTDGLEYIVSGDSGRNAAGNGRLYSSAGT